MSNLVNAQRLTHPLIKLMVGMTALIIGIASWLMALILLWNEWDLTGFLAFAIGVLAFIVLWVSEEIRGMGDGKGDAWLRDD